MAKTSHVPESKKQAVKDIIKLAKEYPIIGAVNMENLPAPQLQKMRSQLRDKVVIRMTKRRLMKMAIEQAAKDKPGLELILPQLKGMPALLFTRENPFSLYKTLQKSKSNAALKPGQRSPRDIVVPAGPTGFAPGPIIGQLGQAGIAAGIDAGKVVIKKDSKVAKEGDIIKGDLAAILARLNITPVEIGLDLVAAFENGEIFTKDVLSVDKKVYLDNITKGHRWAFNLAMFAGIPNKDTTSHLIAKAFRDAKAIAVSQNIYADRAMPDILAKAHNQMLSVKSNVPG
ncbi:50S ribosomal protein L10 [archaeon]|nr:50S ribosomal protein L10 [archaeon]